MKTYIVSCARALVARAELVGYAMVAGPDPSLLSQPAGAIARALHDAGLTTAGVGASERRPSAAAVGRATRLLRVA